jgi:hypothetical protein
VSADSPSSRVARAFFRNPLALSGLGLFGLTLIVAAFAPALAPDGYDEQNIMGRLKSAGLARRGRAPLRARHRSARARHAESASSTARAPR